jgi:hypothetical protein
MPSFQSQNSVYGLVFAGTIIAGLTTRPAAALIVTPKVRLTKATLFNPQPGTLLADLTPDECDYTGYAAGGIAPTWSAQVNLSGSVIGILANVTFICTGSASPSPNTATGYWCDDGTNPIVMEAFGALGPFGFTSPGDYLDLQVNIPFQLFQVF